MNISYDWYRIFYYVALNGNLTAAAEKLYVSQSAVSQSIKQLENSLGCNLFIRTTKGVRLTTEGEILYEYISKGIEHIKLGEKQLALQLNMESGEIHIGASDMTLEYYLLPYLEEFHKLFPKIKINITNGSTPETIKLLEKDIIDFAVISEPVPELKNCSVIPVSEIEDVFICGTDYNNQTITLNNLNTFPLIMLEKNTSTRKYIDTFFADNSISLSPEFELATSSLIVQFVKRNLGIGCVVRNFAEEALRSGKINEIILEKQIPKRHLCIVKKLTSISRASEKLLDLLLK
ncbi:MAG: LysR family transcriptional regulator [Clostridiales bacterium GWF2_36_10]|nr:MAG: LysR family transcriptional regulator [Clostridiales bacterium GWF2_36_10]HAN20103.1 LysR family transcriptional regulator [Clostridiales bacterium]